VLIHLTAWISTDISYGLFLADHTTLDIVESELVIMPAIMCQGLTSATKWHLRGCLRVGYTREEVECIQQAIEHVAETCGKQLKGMPRVWDILDDEL
jgi:alkylhydroperoxidase/carboxymuconolactone decarboxylase family protein YurZ